MKKIAIPLVPAGGKEILFFFMCLYGLSSYVRMDRLRCLVKRALFLVLFVLLSEHKRMLALEGVTPDRSGTSVAVYVRFEQPLKAFSMAVHSMSPHAAMVRILREFKIALVKSLK